jgi:hypothetical protein
MYRFRGKASSLPWDRLRIEIQIRSLRQHAWATAVETVDAFTGSELKSGSGDLRWRRFFALAASSQALEEKGPLVPGTPVNIDTLREELRVLEQELDVFNLLRSYATVTNHIVRQGKGRDDYWYVLELLPEQRQIKISSFQFTQIDRATAAVEQAERRYVGTRNQAVLVRAKSLKELKKAYPSFFADTHYFTSDLQRFLSASGRRHGGR